MVGQCRDFLMVRQGRRKDFKKKFKTENNNIEMVLINFIEMVVTQNN